MVEPEVQQRAADVLLDRGVRVKLPAPFWYRLLGKRYQHHILHRPKLGTLVAMSRVSAQIELDFDKLTDGTFREAYAVVDRYGALVARWVAIALLNDRRSIERMADRLANRLLWGLTTEQLAELFTVVVLLSGVQDFLTTIRFVQQSNVMRRRTEMSQE